VLKYEEQKVLSRLRRDSKPFVFGILFNCTGKSQTAHMPGPLGVIAQKFDTEYKINDMPTRKAKVW
jgi:hypothetical protein